MKRKQSQENVNYLVGIDEVGRGPVAGPVTVGIFIIEKKHLALIKKLGVTDSKKLSEKKRTAITKQIQSLQKKNLCNYICISQSARMIDKKGIVYCIKQSIIQGLKKINVPYHATVFLDGGLSAPDIYHFQKTFIKGDQKIPVISAASIVAKVYRDAVMMRYAKKYPHYDFEKHKGYGTKKHYKNIEKYGFLPLHRKTFLKNYKGIDKKSYL